jgi:hypothetical protein
MAGNFVTVVLELASERASCQAQDLNSGSSCAGAPICRALKAQFQTEFANQFGASADACAQFKYNKVSTLVICLRIIRLAQFVQYLEPLARFR